MQDPLKVVAADVNAVIGKESVSRQKLSHREMKVGGARTAVCQYSRRGIQRDRATAVRAVMYIWGSSTCPSSELSGQSSASRSDGNECNRQHLLASQSI